MKKADAVELLLKMHGDLTANDLWDEMKNVVIPRTIRCRFGLGVNSEPNG